jgi:hypothetical protein
MTRENTDPDPAAEPAAPPSLIPAEFLDAGAKAQEAEDKRRRARRERYEREQFLADAVKLLHETTEPLLGALTEEQARPLLPAARAGLISAVRALDQAGRLDRWAQIDRDQTYARYRFHNDREMIRASFDLACWLFEQFRGDRPPEEGVLAEAWRGWGLRDAVRWLRVIVFGLSGEGGVLDYKAPPEGDVPTSSDAGADVTEPLRGIPPPPAEAAGEPGDAAPPSDGGEPAPPGGWSICQGVEQWAHVFDVSRATMRRMLQDNRVRYKKLGRQTYLIAIADIPEVHQERFRSAE